MSERTDARHRDRRGGVGATFAEFMDEVYLAMGEDDRERLPDDISGYVAAIVTHALNRLEAFGESLAQTVAGVYERSPHGERFIRNPHRGAQTSTAPRRRVCHTPAPSSTIAPATA
jgi:hypothetical protein